MTKVTVADVKRYCGKGFEFVFGDQAIDELSGERYGEATNEGFLLAINNRKLYDKCFVELAPRPNTGVQPVGDDVVVILGTSVDVRMYAESANWGNSYLKNWKPCLKWIAEQVEKDSAVKVTTEENTATEDVAEKPIFPQAMADAGEFPPTGHKAVATHCGDGEECEIVHYNKHQVCVIWDKFQGGSMDVLLTSEWAFSPIKTDREKAIDNMIGDVRTFPNEFVQLNRLEAGRLVDAGYTKESK